MLSRPAFGVGAALAAGVALGLCGRASDYLGPELRLLFALGAPWFVVAFGVGALQRRPLAGAAAGAVSLAISVAVYYAVMLTVERRAGHGYAAWMTVLWGGAAVPVGLLFGAAGAAAMSRRDHLRAAALTLLGGALAGEALLFLARSRASNAGPVLACELVAGAALILAASRPPRARVIALGATIAVLAASADGALRMLIRARGWGG